MHGNDVYNQTNHAISDFKDKPANVIGKELVEQAKKSGKIVKNVVDDISDLLE